MLSDFELAKKILTENPGITAREVARRVSEMGIKWDKGHANSILYKMLNQGLVQKHIINGPRPCWTINSVPTNKDQSYKINKITISQDQVKEGQFIPLSHIKEYEKKIQGIAVQFAIDQNASPSDCYITCDWLEKRIFVSINNKHPYIQKNIYSDKILKEFLAYMAMDAYLEWRIVIDLGEKISFDSIILKDKILRQLAQF